MTKKKTKTKQVIELPLSNDNLLPQSKYAELRGVTPARINHLVKDGILNAALTPGIHRGRKHVLINVKVADEIIIKTQDSARDDFRKFGNVKNPGELPAKETKKNNEEPEDYKKSVAKEKQYKALLAELEYLEKKGTLVKIEDVQKTWENQISATKAKLRSIPNKAAQKIAHLALDAHNSTERLLIVSIQDALLKEIDEVLGSIANGS
jgi:hypothetical protein